MGRFCQFQRTFNTGHSWADEASRPLLVKRAIYTVVANKHDRYIDSCPPFPLRDTPWDLFLVVPLFTRSHQTKIHVIQTKIHHFKALCKQHTFSHLTVNFQHACSQQPFNKTFHQGRQEGCNWALVGQCASEGHQEPTEDVCTNMEDWKREIVKLWVTRMSDNSYLQNLVESMPRRLQEVIERVRDTTKYWYIPENIRNKDFTWFYFVSFVLKTFILASSLVFSRQLYI